MKKRHVGLLAEVAEIKRIYAATATRLASFKSACVVVTSAARGEGKSSLAALLATAAATYSRRNVLIVDFNWHNPALDQLFGLQEPVGFGVLKKEEGLGKEIQESGFKRLDVLPAPRQDQCNDLSSGESIALAFSVMEEAKSKYDLVVIDTSAMFPTNRKMLDPVVISAAADGVILTILAAQTPRQQVKKTLISLETAGANVLGTIVNQWKNPVIGK
jgi:Mrp family chromosome partitioning ATPase